MNRTHLISVTSAVAAAALLALGIGNGGFAPRPALTEVTRSATWVDDSKTTPASRRGRKRDVAEVRRKLEQGANGTYIADVLVEHDSALARWRDRVDEPLRVWIDTAPPLEGWNADLVNQVRTAFEAWTETGIPIRFEFVADSAGADVDVTWVDRFDEPISGKTRWARDNRWWIVDGSITLALHHNSGPVLSSTAIHAIALHEVGHLLGLDHSRNIDNIMTPRVRVKTLSDEDRATMKLLYTLPPGAVR